MVVFEDYGRTIQRTPMREKEDNGSAEKNDLLSFLVIQNARMFHNYWRFIAAFENIYIYARAFNYTYVGMERVNLIN